MSAKRRIYVLDTSLRDGTQAAGVSFSLEGKLRLARRLDEFGVDYIEGGYAGSTARDMAFFEACGRETFSRARVTAFGSTRRAGVRVGEDAGVTALIRAGTPAVTVVGKAWDLHARDVLRASETENRAMIRDTVRCLKENGREVLFDAEHFFDGYKSAPGFALGALRAAVEGGADVLVLCDTNGGSLPHEIAGITAAVAGTLEARLGIHTHNDAGLAAANTLEAVRAGADHVQGTINGFGERCGNANLCTIIPTLCLKLNRACLRRGALADLTRVSGYFWEEANLRPDERAPYVGGNAFAHKAGLHADAAGKNPRAVEHIDPALVGNRRRIVVSEASGSSSILLKAIEVGVDLRRESPEIKEIRDELKALEGRGYEFEAADASFRMLVQKVLRSHVPFFELEGFRVIVEKRGRDEPCVSEATVKVRVRDEFEYTAGEGIGPVDALNTALRRALVRFYPQLAGVHLTDFKVRILNPDEATAATTRVLIESSDGDETWGTVGVSENIIEASWEALVEGLEYKLFREEEKRTRAATASKRGRGPRAGGRGKR